MSRDRQRGFAVSLLIPGLLLLVMGLGGTWGSAYGQTAGLLPPAVVPTITGVEGEPVVVGIVPEVAGEVGEVVDVPVVVVPPELVAGEVGEVPSLIGATGADAGMQWQLLLVGVLLLAGGGLIFLRARRAH